MNLKSDFIWLKENFNQTYMLAAFNEDMTIMIILNKIIDFYVQQNRLDTQRFDQKKNNYKTRFKFWLSLSWRNYLRSGWQG